MDISSSPRTIIITGANKGIGFEIAKKLYNQAKTFKIILTSRDKAKGEEAIKKIKETKESTNSELYLGILDIVDSTSIDNFVSWVKNEFGSFDVLVNNAGYGYQLFDIEDGLRTLATNFFGLVELTEKLLPLLTKDGKIINISSGAGDLSNQKQHIRNLLNDSQLTSEKLVKIARDLYDSTKDKLQDNFGWSNDHYANSKCLVNAYTRWALPKLLLHDQTCYACTPGYCLTDMTKDHQSGRTDKPPGPAEDGALTPLYLIELPFQKDPQYHTKFFRNCQPETYDKSTA